MPSKEILQIKNCFHITVIYHFHLQLVSKSVGQKVLGLKLVKLDCIIIYLDVDATKTARNELDGASVTRSLLLLMFVYLLIFQVNKFFLNKNFL